MTLTQKNEVLKCVSLTRRAISACPCSWAPIAAFAALAPLLRSVVAGPGATLKPEREVAVLFAAHQFCHDAGHPKGLLTRIFRDLYNDDVLDEPAMKRWQADTSNAVPGRALQY